MSAYVLDYNGVQEAEVVNLEIAMRSLARAAALAEERWGLVRLDDQKLTKEMAALRDAGAFWVQAKTICAQLDRDWLSVADSARRYADGVMRGRTEIA